MGSMRDKPGLIGVIHLLPMPGDPRHAGGGFHAVRGAAMRDAETWTRGGADALLIENFGSAPFSKGTAGQRLPPHQVAALALLAGECMRSFERPTGVNCLRNDAIAAIGIAAAAELSFVRVNVHVGTYATDQGIIEGEAADSLRYRQALGAADVAIYADILVKHARPLADLSPGAMAHDAIDRGLADGLIVTGDATGSPVARELLLAVGAACTKRPLLIGSGLTPDNAADLAPLADGAIVGTWAKEAGELAAPVDLERVRRLAATVRPLFGSGR